MMDIQYPPKPQWPQVLPQKPSVPQQKPQQTPQKPQVTPQTPQVTPQRPQQDQQRPQVTQQRPQVTQQRPQQNQQTQYSKTPELTPEPFHKCEVEERFKIQCGPRGTDSVECSAINCCFDGGMCFYGKSVTLQCTKDAQMIVVVARDATLPNIDLPSISFLGEDPLCEAVGVTSAFAVYQFPLTACGTLLMEEPGVVIYENRMSSLFEVALGPYGVITRDSQYELLVQCRYYGTAVQALVVEVGGLPAPPPVAAPGPLRVELRLGNGQCVAKGCVEEEAAYNSFYVDSDYPVTKVLRDPVYVEVRILERTDPNLVLTLGRCWATSNPYPHSFPQWDLLIDGCPYSDDRYRTARIPVDHSPDVSYPTHYKRFVFKMFTFVAPGLSNPGKGFPKGPIKGGSDPQVMVPLNEKV
ncbi:Zona pellucida sperm-binding protein 1 [Liparis tanakae]|uniref:Zona pellucida sperm-binding protein 4 n=1 Tax=Liparis tanakae TaxID=230148 RepID=A0A4Z2FWD9_9TELE|nr:Zona pellucida sperm-binding protein 1 [Liparis tanakae]